MKTYKVMNGGKAIYIAAHDAEEAERICWRDFGFFPDDVPEEIDLR